MVLFNPSSGKGKTLKYMKTITQQLSKGRMAIDCIVTESEDHLRRTAASAVKTSDQYVAIVGVGGDTTFNIIASEILKHKNDYKPEIALGMIGTGSANDVTKSLGLKTIDAACRAIINGNIKKMDVGYVKICKKLQPFQSSSETETFFFLGTLSLGLGVTVNQYVEGFHQQHKILSKWKPLNQILPALYSIYDSFSKKKIPLQVDMEYQNFLNNEHIKLPVKFSLLVFLNTPFYANGLQLGVDNGIADGVLDCCIINTKSFLQTIIDGIRIWRRERSQINNLTLFQSNWFKITSPECIDFQVDGEIIQRINEIEISIIPRCLDVFSI